MAEIVFKSGDVINCEKINPNRESYVSFENMKIKGLYADIELVIDGKEGVIVYPIIYYDSRRNIESYMEIDEELTEQIQEDFDRDYSGGGWVEWIAKWLEKKGYEPDLKGNTYAFEYDGDVYEFVSFKSRGVGEDGVVIMWHGGGDVRWNYEYPIVYKDDMYYSFEDILSLESYDKYINEEEVAYEFGYEGDFKAMNEDFQRQYFEKCLNNQMSESYRMRRFRKRLDW